MPAKQLLRRQTVPARNSRDHRTWREALFDNPRLLVSRKPTPAASPGNHFKPVYRLRLKHMVKLRHKPISD